MVNKLIVDISIEQVSVTHFSRFTLDQRFNEHHTFELRINHDQMEDTNSITLFKSKDFIGKSLTVQFGVLGDNSNIFTGIITKVEIAQTHGFRGDIIVTGYSPDILIDRGASLGSYLNKDLKSILQQATSDTPQNDLHFQIQPAYNAAIDYIIQYKESDFDFINRLSAQYHEWFYYDGRILHFGKPDQQEEIALVYGRDLHSMQYGMQVVPLNYQKFAYQSSQDQLINAQPSVTSNNLSDVSHVVSASNKIYSKQFNQPLNARANSQKEMDTFVNDEHKALVSGLVNINGRGDNPQVGIGKIVDIRTSMRNGLDFQVEDFGKFVVTAIHHEIDGIGHYHHTFEGITADSEKLAVSQTVKPQPDMQLANVVDNNDPEGQGRVKVKFKWTCQANDPTEWLRVVSPDAGSSDQVSKNRGFTFIPENGDQVIVAFEEGNIARPIVMGSIYHGNNGAGGGGNNHLKTIITRSGTKIQFDDDDSQGSVTVSDPSGNQWYMDGKGNITVTAPKNITLNAGENIIQNAGLNVLTTAGVNISDNAGTTIVQNAGAMITQTALSDYILSAANIMETAKGGRTSQAKEIKENGKTKTSTSTDVTTFNSKQDINSKSGENTKHG